MAVRILDIVHHRAEDVRSYGLQAPHALAEGPFTSILRVEYEKDTVTVRSQNSGIGDQPYRRRVHENIIEPFSYRSYEFGEAPRTDQLGWIRRCWPNGHDLQAVQNLLTHVLQTVISYQNVYYPVDISQPEKLVHHGFSKVAVYYENALVDLRQHHPQISASGALPLLRTGAAHHDHFRGIIHGGVEQVGA